MEKRKFNPNQTLPIPGFFSFKQLNTFEILFFFFFSFKIILIVLNKRKLLSNYIIHIPSRWN